MLYGLFFNHKEWLYKCCNRCSSQIPLENLSVYFVGKIWTSYSIFCPSIYCKGALAHNIHKIHFLAWTNLYTVYLPTAIEASIFITTNPMDTNATLGDTILCDCRYTGTEDLPLWKINGALYSPSAVPPGYMANKTGLYFQAHHLLHKSTYQCLFAIYNDSSESIEVIESFTGTVFVSQG